MKIGSILAIIAVLFLTFFIVSKKWFRGTIVGSGAQITRTIPLDRFEAIKVSGAYDRVTFIQSDRFELVYEGYQNLYDNLEIRNRNGELIIENKKRFLRMVSNTPRLTIYGKDLSKVNLSGATNFYAEHIENNNQLDIYSSGASEMKIDVKCPSVKVKLSGAGSVKISGLTRDFTATISGAADIKAYDLMSENTEVNISGAGNAQVYASKSLNAKATGAGNISYKGDPVVRVKTSGVGSVTKKD
ncbi:head GIN domain-containing protein [Gynurincola endophyticus]|uniref:head GIN domain-containing protein n=1 Tax=Gynurincola endophyticus TaxID=2479004 RepID=UPI000F8DD43B|nr:head GIN domain-containing protein [Gynurincola endophyticus]